MVRKSRVIRGPGLCGVERRILPSHDASVAAFPLPVAERVSLEASAFDRGTARFAAGSDGRDHDIMTTRAPSSLILAPKTLESALAMVEAMAPADRAQLSRDWLARIHGPAPDHWTLGYLLVHAVDGGAVGQCGFKGPPDESGMVEIAYGVEPEFRGRGYATEAARLLVEIAFGCDRVRVVRAHTFEPGNASARVLTKCGFRSLGAVTDPEDGVVWRWEKAREGSLV